MTVYLNIGDDTIYIYITIYGTNVIGYIFTSELTHQPLILHPILHPIRT